MEECIKTFYEDLYDIRNHFVDLPQETFSETVDGYIAETKLPTLSEDVLEGLDKPLTLEENLDVIKEMLWARQIYSSLLQNSCPLVICLFT